MRSESYGGEGEAGWDLVRGSVELRGLSVCVS